MLKIGSLLKSRYRIDEHLGSGGMSEVYKVWDEERGVYLAMKVLKGELAEDKIFIRRFRREAKVLEKLQHPNIVRFYGLEEEPETVFMLMEYIDGTTLRKEIYRRKKPFKSTEILEILNPVCKALFYAHKNGVVHEDIKPGNILIDQSGRVYLTDFGIARLVEGSTVTMAGAGTPAYMSPEQIKGQDPAPSMDIYSLGVVLYEMITGGERPFTGEDAKTTGTTSEKIRWEQLNRIPPSPKKYNKKVTPELEAMILKCLEKQSAKRYESAKELFDDIQRAFGKSFESEIEKSTLKTYTGEERSLQPLKVLSHEKTLTVGNQTNEHQKAWGKGKQIGLIFSSVFIVVGIILLCGQWGGGLGIMLANKIPTFLTAMTSTNNLTPTKVITNTLTSTSTLLPTPFSTPTLNPLLNGLEGRISFRYFDGFNSRIAMINADGSNLTFLTNSNDGNFYNPRLSLNGKKIVFIGDNGVYTINSDGLNIQQIISGGKAWAPSLSPNGEEIILENGNGLGFSIFKADGSFIMNLPTNGLNCTQPMFSPNGRDIAYICVDNNTGGSLRIMNSNGSNQRELFSGAVKVEYPAWSPDSQSIAFRMWGIISNQDQASDRIYKISIYGGKPIPLSPADIGSWEPSFSPDGKHIVFTRERYGDNQWVTNPDGSKWVSNYFQDLWIMNADGSNPIQLTDFYSGEPSWGP